MADSKNIKSRKIKNVSSEEKKEDSKNEKVTKIKTRRLHKEVISKLDTENLKQVSKESKVKKNDENKKVKNKKIRMSFTAKQEARMDKEIENSDNLSVGLMIVILVLCFVVGISLGYVLYRIAINSSNAMFIVKYLFGWYFWILS